MRSAWFRRFVCLMILFAPAVFCLILPGWAEEIPVSAPALLESRDETTKYRAVVADDVGAMSLAEQQSLLKMVLQLAKYGNAAFWITEEHSDKPSQQAQQKLTELFPSGGLLLVFNRTDGSVAVKCSGTLQTLIGEQKALFLAQNSRDGFVEGRVCETAKSLFMQYVFLCSSNTKKEEAGVSGSLIRDRLIFVLKLALLLFASTPLWIMLAGLIHERRQVKNGTADFQPDRGAAAHGETNPVRTDPQLTVDREARLRQLDSWLKQGLIDKKEYRELKKRYK